MAGQPAISCCLPSGAGGTRAQEDGPAEESADDGPPANAGDRAGRPARVPGPDLPVPVTRRALLDELAPVFQAALHPRAVRGAGVRDDPGQPPCRSCRDSYPLPNACSDLIDKSDHIYRGGDLRLG